MKSFLLFLALSHLFVPSSYAASSLGGNCQARYGEVGSDGTFKYFETGIGNLKCDNSNGANLVCIPENDDGTNSDFPGICEAKYCMEPELATQGKVTVCHRTCSETNPWVRITIDSSAWSSTNCKHGQHTTAKCTGKNLTLWGENQQDYVLKYHGTRDEVAASLNGVSTDINNYWKHWEPACPSVRNGFCCQFSGTYGYSCCGRAFIDPILPPPTPKPTPAPIAPTVAPTPSPTPRPTTAAPVIAPVTPAPVAPAPTLAPVTSPVATQAPQAVPTRAPVAAPTTIAPVTAPSSAPTPAPLSTPSATPAPQSASTIAPVVAASPTASPTSSSGGAPSPSNVCRLRRQLQQQQGQTLDQKWNISEPDFEYGDLTFSLDFNISDYIARDDMIQYKMMEQSCTTQYNGNGLLTTKGPRVSIGSQLQGVEISIDIDSSVISQDLEVYSEPTVLVDNQRTASVDFCLRFSLYTPPEAGDMEVNFLEVIVHFDVDLTDGFRIDEVTVEALDPCEKAAQDAYEVEGYFCADGDESIKLLNNPVIQQGDIVKVCVRPMSDGLANAIRMRTIREFTWSLNDGSVSQDAIVDYQAASNGLTELWCTPGYAICHFESILFATFFQRRGTVIGSGVADLQFGGEVSMTSVSPRRNGRQRRIEEDNNSSQEHVQRQLQQQGQEGASGPTAEFNMEFDVQPTAQESTSGSYSITMSSSRIGLMILAFASAALL